MLDKESDFFQIANFYDGIMGSAFSDTRRVLIPLLNELGMLASSNFGQRITEQKKGEIDFSTSVDVRIEEQISDSIRRLNPDHEILGEEGGSSGHSEHQWVIDPIDGTFNFTTGIPFFAISIALLRKGLPILGIIYDPLRRELFYAEKGEGTWLEREQKKVSNTDRLANAMICLDIFPDDPNAKKNLELMIQLLPYVRSQRMLGTSALALAYLSCGRIDGFYHNHAYPWDVAAAQLLVEEAGGKITDYDNESFSTLCNEKKIVASNGLLHDQLAEHFRTN